MKKLFFLTLFLFAVAFFSQSVNAQTEAQRIELCSRLAGSDATYQNSYPVQLSAAMPGGRAPSFKQGIAILKGNTLRFTICTDEESSGEAILSLYDQGKLVASSYIPETGKMYQSIDFNCNKTGPYVLEITFKDGREGSAVGIMSLVKKFK